MTTPILPLTLQAAGYAPNGVALLTDISLTLYAGQRLVILGANGAGKSLLLRLCHGLIDPTSGARLWANGQTRPDGQAMVFQRPILLRRTVAANLDYALALRGQAKAQRRETVALALARFGLAAFAQHPARLLSGGEQQRLALARAWVLRPEVLFLDEPTSALDPSATRQIEQMIMDFSADGITTALTTHNLGQARRLAQQVAFLQRGQLLEHGPADGFFAGPQTPQARAFLAGDLIW